MNEFGEKPFEQLRKKDGSKFSTDTIRNWYIARCYVLNVLSEKVNEALSRKDEETDHSLSPESKLHLHFVLENDSSRMLFIARQIALSAHYINFNEEGDVENFHNRTIISVISDDSGIKQKLSAEEYMCNLPKYCRYVEGGKMENPDSYLDIEIHIVSGEPSADGHEIRLEITNDEVDDYFNGVAEEDEKVFTIDTRKAFYACRMYDIGGAIDNLPAENIHDTKRYTMALNIYQYVKLKDAPGRLFDNHVKVGEQYKLKETLSNVFCSDCFASRAYAMRLLNRKNLKNEGPLWEKYNMQLSRSEHARWVAEKLIMGYRPLSEEELYKNEELRAQFNSKNKIKEYQNSLKRNDKELAHIDICSLRDVRRITPNDLKYDSFLMLAIPKILERVGELHDRKSS